MRKLAKEALYSTKLERESRRRDRLKNEPHKPDQITENIRRIDPDGLKSRALLLWARAGCPGDKTPQEIAALYPLPT